MGESRGGYTLANAAEFSDMMAQRMGGAVMGTNSMYYMCFSIMHLEESRRELAIRQSFRWQHRRKEKAEQPTGAGMALEVG